MADVRPSTRDSVRLSELMAAWSMAIDVGMVMPMEFGLRVCSRAVRLGRGHQPGGDCRSVGSGPDLRRTREAPTVVDHRARLSDQECDMAVFRILEAKARPGAVDRLADLLVQQERSIVAASPGAVFAQSLRSGDQVLAVSSWESAEDMQRYLDQEATREFYRALPELLMGTPSIRTYEVIQPRDGAAGWADGNPDGGGGRP